MNDGSSSFYGNEFNFMSDPFAAALAAAEWSSTDTTPRTRSKATKSQVQGQAPVETGQGGVALSGSRALSLASGTDTLQPAASRTRGSPAVFGPGFCPGRPVRPVGWVKPTDARPPVGGFHPPYECGPRPFREQTPGTVPDRFLRLVGSPRLTGKIRKRNGSGVTSGIPPDRDESHRPVEIPGLVRLRQGDRDGIPVGDQGRNPDPVECRFGESHAVAGCKFLPGRDRDDSPRLLAGSYLFEQVPGRGDRPKGQCRALVSAIEPA